MHHHICGLVEDGEFQIEQILIFKILTGALQKLFFQGHLKKIEENKVLYKKKKGLKKSRYLTKQRKAEEKEIWLKKMKKVIKIENVRFVDNYVNI